MEDLGISHWLGPSKNLRQWDYTMETLEINLAVNHYMGYQLVAYAPKHFQNIRHLSIRMSMLSLRWTELVEDIGRVHPIPGRNCTLAIVNPMSSILQWLSVDCYKQYTVSSLICERNNDGRALH